ncbi:MAG: DsrE family protein [Daejeonella sp.]
MKKIALVFAVLLLMSPTVLKSQTSDYKVVFDLTNKDTDDHKMVIKWLKEVINADKNAQMEVVLYGKSLDMIVKDRSTVASDITQLSKNPNVSFKVCAIAMKNNNIQKEQLVEGVQTVPDGIYEVISKQKQGWGYIKVTH